jgi:hypothetical protein
MGDSTWIGGLEQRFPFRVDSTLHNGRTVPYRALIGARHRIPA